MLEGSPYLLHGLSCDGLCRPCRHPRRRAAPGTKRRRLSPPSAAICHPAHRQGNGGLTIDTQLVGMAAGCILRVRCYPPAIEPRRAPGPGSLFVSRELLSVDSVTEFEPELPFSPTSSSGVQIDIFLCLLDRVPSCTTDIRRGACVPSCTTDMRRLPPAAAAVAAAAAPLPSSCTTDILRERPDRLGLVSPRLGLRRGLFLAGLVSPDGPVPSRVDQRVAIGMATGAVQPTGARTHRCQEPRRSSPVRPRRTSVGRLWRARNPR